MQTDQERIAELERDLAAAKTLWSQTQTRLEEWVSLRDQTIRALRAKLIDAGIKP